MSFPNPAMLPFFAAGGAISGSSFGLFYTILMQVGYNYYGKKVLADLEGGMSLFDSLQKVQKEIRPFSDAMMQAALDAMPETIEKSIDAFVNITKSFTESRMQDLAESWLLPKGTVIPEARVQPAPTVPTVGNVPEVKTFVPPTNIPVTGFNSVRCVQVRKDAQAIQKMLIVAHNRSLSSFQGGAGSLSVRIARKTAAKKSLILSISTRLNTILNNPANAVCVKGMTF